MTVGELIEKLKEFSNETIVVTFDSKWEEYDICEQVNIIKAPLRINKIIIDGPFVEIF